MSATIDADRFARYFGEQVPIVRVPGLAYPVTDFFLEDVVTRCGFRAGKALKAQAPPFAEWRGALEAGQVAGDNDAWCTWLRTLAQTHGDDVAAVVQRLSSAAAREIDFELVASVVESICDTGAAGAILVFLPGWTDITALHDMLLSNGCTRRHACSLMPLHSQLPMGDQAAVFARPPPGVRKVIIATGIAGYRSAAFFTPFPIHSSRKRPPSPSMTSSTWSTQAVARAGLRHISTFVDIRADSAATADPALSDLL